MTVVKYLNGPTWPCPDFVLPCKPEEEAGAKSDPPLPEPEVQALRLL